MNEAMAFGGAIGATPDTPQVAFTFNFLETYRQLHRVCPRLSLEGVSKALLHLHKWPRKLHLARQLSGAYDAYLAILRLVELDVRGALHQNDIQIQAEQLCAPCMYKLDNETSLRPSILACMDGNNSLKLIDDTFKSGQPRRDSRQLKMFRFLEPEEVDLYKDDVANAQAARRAKSSKKRVKMKQDLNKCIDQWRNAGPEARKKMVELFTISGIFITLCHHGPVLVMCDMIRSGELMKYPIVQVNYLIDKYGMDIGLAYDIMCAFMKT
ncbi:hypothetical protein FISHEDRAFT_45873, partial [Fistulina hepatica ATCC 64428]